jgi:hypothetical protein
MTNDFNMGAANLGANFSTIALFSRPCEAVAVAWTLEIEEPFFFVCRISCEYTFSMQHRVFSREIG